MPRLILHIGAEKTGTTSLQRAAEHGHGSALWFPSRELGGLSMPLLAYAFGQPGCVQEFVPRIQGQFGDISPSGARELIARELQGPRDLPIFLSCELLYSRFDRGGYQRLRDFLFELADDFSVCCVFRDVRPVIDGLLGEALKAGHPVDDPMLVFDSHYGFDRCGFFDFDGKIDALRTIFGNALVLLKYETLIADGRLIPNFFDALNLSCEAHHLALNPKLNHFQGWALQRLNRITRRLPYRHLPFRICRRGILWLFSGFSRAFEPADAIPAINDELFRRQASIAQCQLDELWGKGGD